jgi:hypothetical protein
MPDQERMPQTYRDLLTLWEAAEPWQPPAVGQQAAEPARPIGSDLDHFADSQIADALQIDVLGMREDHTIEVYSTYYRRTVSVRDHDKLRFSRMLQLFGGPVVRKVVTVAAEDVPGMWSVSDVRNMLGSLSGRRPIGDETKRGFGCWSNSSADGLVLVNLGEGLHFSSAGVERIEHPRYEDMLLDFSSGAKAWYDYNQLMTLLQQAESTKWRESVADDLVNLFCKWRWRGKQDVLITTALVFATWLQTLWTWRPRIDVLGASGSGKTVLCDALMGLFRHLTISTYDTTAAGLRQEMRKSAKIVVVDEIDTKNRKELQKQREILKMLRSASRSSGAVAIRGTPGGEATSFSLQHLCWLVGISQPYEDQADRNRAIIMNLLPAVPEMQNKLRLPEDDVLGQLGQRSLAAALLVAHTARRRAVSLKDTQVEGADPRQVESYAVPAAMLSAIQGMSDEDAVGLLRQMLADACESGEAIEADEVILMKCLLGAHVQLGQYRLTVGQVIEHLQGPTADNYQDWLRVLAGAGVRVDIGATRSSIMFQYQQVQSNLLRNTRWEGQEISQYLRRLAGAETTRQRVGNVHGRGVKFDLAQFLAMFSGDGGEAAEPPVISPPAPGLF